MIKIKLLDLQTYKKPFTHGNLRATNMIWNPKGSSQLIPLNIS
jgi:hypothetical protein